MIIFKIIKKIISGVMLAVGIGVLALIALGVLNYFWHPNDPPSIQDAPWIVQTTSRTYYAQEITSINGTPAIKHFWVSDGGWFKEYKDIQVFDKRLYGTVKVIRRAK